MAGLQLVAPTAANAAPTCPTGWTSYNVTLHETRSDGHVHGTGGGANPLTYDSLNDDSMTLCSHTTTACSPACSSGDVYLYDDNLSYYWDGWSTTYQDQIVVFDSSQTSATEFVFQCTGGSGEFSLYNVGSGQYTEEYGTLGGISPAFADGAATYSYGSGNADNWHNEHGTGFCY